MSFGFHGLAKAARWCALGGLLALCSLGRAAATRPMLAPLWSLRGDVACRYGERACNRCVRGVVSAVAALRPRPSALVRYSSMVGRALPPYRARLAPFARNDSHLEGIARLSAPDSNVLVLSRARPGVVGGGGFFLVRLSDVPDHRGAPFGHAGDPVRFVNSDPAARAVRYYHPVDLADHPGGLQLEGRILVLAVSCASSPECRERAFVQLDDLSDPAASETLLQRVPLFIQGEPHRVAHATSVAMARVQDGRYLMFVQGKDDQREGWFYLSAGAELDAATDFRYLTRVEGGAEWSGAYQSTSLLTDCDSGKLYLLGTGNPTFRATVRPRWSPAVLGEMLSMFIEGGVDEGREILHLFELQEREGRIALQRVFATTFRPDPHAFCSFRAAASAYVTPDGRLALYCTTRKANTNLLGQPDSKLKLAELAPP